MHSALRVFSVFVVFCFTCVAWLVLGAVMKARTHDQERSTQSRVSDLWGSAQTQTPPELYAFPLGRAPMYVAGGPTQEGNRVTPSRTRIGVDLRLDQRLKGLTWYSLYDVDFGGQWTYRNETTESQTLRVVFSLPDERAVYDGYLLTIDDEEVRAAAQRGGSVADVTVEPGQDVVIAARYKSRGMDEWHYQRAEGTAPLRDFDLEMTTNFTDVDFPAMSLSPSSKEASGSGYKLSWTFEQLVSGFGVGMIMPKRIQPGELAASLAFSAPISLFFFFLVVAVLARMRNLDIHPINYFFLGAAFFSFHLLFSYSVDHLALPLAFGIASAVSVAMVVSYLRLVVSSRFAYREAAAAQLIYLVGFSMAHFLEGFTGLTVTVLSIATLFLLMLLTGRIRWTEALRQKAPERSEALHVGQPSFPTPPPPATG